jgi:hypothetical protein
MNLATQIMIQDPQETLEEIRAVIEEKNLNFEHDLQDLRRRHTEQLSLLKQDHVAQEQAAANSYNLEFRNVIWDLTLKHLGRGMFTEDLGRMLQRNLSEEQFKCEKELLELQQSYDDEIAQMRANAPAIRKKKHRKRERMDPGMLTLNPHQMAEKISEKLKQFAVDEVGEGPEGEALDFLLQILKQERENIVGYRLSPTRRPLAIRSTPIAVKRKLPVEKPRVVPYVERVVDPMAPRTGLRKHVAARAKLKKSVAKADRFMHNLRGQEWFGDLFPHVE